jgi:NAD kinase
LGSTAFNHNNGGKVLPINSKLWSITSVVCNKNIDEVINPHTITIKNLSDRTTPILYVDGVASKLILTFGDTIKLKSKEQFTIAFLNIADFNTKRTKLLQARGGNVWKI